MKLYRLRNKYTGEYWSGRKSWYTSPAALRSAITTTRHNYPDIKKEVDWEIIEFIATETENRQPLRRVE